MHTLKNILRELSPVHNWQGWLFTLALLFFLGVLPSLLEAWMDGKL